MSITISNCNEICNSPTNSSKAKMLYTFTKEQRFPKRKIIMCDKFYDAKENSPVRATSLGFGNKYDFTKDVPKSPSPNKYNVKSEFSVDKKKGFGFGCGREQMQITGPFVGTLKNRNPGPGLYSIKSTIQECHTFAMRGKNYHEDHQKLKVPGPGAYPVSFAINQKGMYYLSKHKNSCVRNFKTVSARAKILENKIPGPGAYDMHTDLSPDGKYCSSKMPSVQTRKFGSSDRSNIFSKLMTPGPGNYKLPSQFGYYCAKNAVKKPATQENSRKINRDLNENTKENKQNKENVQH